MVAVNIYVNSKKKQILSLQAPDGLVYGSSRPGKQLLVLDEHFLFVLLRCLLVLLLQIRCICCFQLQQVKPGAACVHGVYLNLFLQIVHHFYYESQGCR